MCDLKLFLVFSFA